MNIDEVLNFFDTNTVWRNQKAQREFLKTGLRKELDTILTTDSLFKGTVVGFDFDLYSGGGSYGTFC